MVYAPARYAGRMCAICCCMSSVKSLLRFLFVISVLVPKVSGQTTLMPVVTIKSTDPFAMWSGDTGTFAVVRSGPTNQTLNVFYLVSGTAKNGVDYEAIGSWVMIAAGSWSNTITVKPIDLGQTNGATVILRLSPSPMGIAQNYRIGVPDTAVVYITPQEITNVPPYVKLFAPANGQIFYSPTNVHVDAFAGDVDGAVKSVEFFAGDKSLVSLVAHELAHSWSGNLVTNATWSDFWLNEGFTVYVERRILEKVYGRPREEMEAVLGRQELEREIAKLPAGDQLLHIDLKGRDPDDGVTSVPYEKGALMLRSLEERYGREKFDAFLRQYFDHFAFQSITTEVFVNYLQEHLLKGNSPIPLDEWLYKPGLPASAPRPSSDAFEKVAAQAQAGDLSKVQTAGWTTQEWLHFLRALPRDLGAARMRELDRAFSLTRSGNSEILDEWLLMAVRNHYEPAYPRLEEFLASVGRRKYVKPLYEELMKSPEGKARAEKIYRRARSGYHPITAGTVDGILAPK